MSSEKSVSRAKFEAGTPVQLSVPDVMAWIKHHQAPWGDTGQLMLPPLQRNGVWRPKQVLDLWRSVLEGMPIGLFYLARPGEEVVDLKTGKMGVPPPGSLNLFDGQQRIRALALGAGDPYEEERRIWVKFTGVDYELVLSSKTQPAGYKSDGSRLSVADRREWLKTLDGKPDGLRRTYGDFPAGCSTGDTVLLETLLAPPTNRAVTPPTGANMSAWSNFQGHLVRLRQNPCAIFVMLPKGISGCAEQTLELFRRIGAGGTPLSEAEQIYSAYKLRKPEIRTVVEAVHEQVSFLLTPAQIVQAVLRMANTLANPGTGWPHGFNVAIRAFSKDTGTEPWVKKLDGLLTTPDGHGSLIDAFTTVRNLLSQPGQGAFSLPDIVVSQLAPELWQVLAFWCLNGQRYLKTDQADVVRFAMAWHLAVMHQERAAQICFRLLANPSPGLSWPALFEAMVTDRKTALAIPDPRVMAPFFETPQDLELRWLSWKERFDTDREGIETAYKEIASTWWFSRKMLPWLQRDYVKTRFADYKPLSDHEDDLPYDFDHICARAHWNVDGRKFKDEKARSSKTPEPWVIGDSIGNMRLVYYIQNRSDGAAGIFDKMPFLENPGECPELGTASDFLMEDVSEHDLWRTVDKSPRQDWGSDDERLVALQKVVGQRALRLYEQFYEGLGFSDWKAQAKSAASSPPD